MWLALLGLVIATWTIITYTTVILEIGWIVLGALLLALGMRPVVTRMTRWRIPRPVTVLAIYAIGLGLVLLLGNLLLPILSAEITPLRQHGPALLQDIFNRLAQTPFAQWAPTTDTLVQNLSAQMSTVIETTLGTVANVSSILLDLLLLLILSFFFAVDESWVSQLLLSWTPATHRTHVQHIIDKVETQLIRWVWSLPVMTIYFTVTFGVGLMVLGVPFAFTIGVIGGVLEVIPYVGGVVATILAMVSALTVNPALVAWVVVLHLSISLAEGHIIAPLLYGHAVGLRTVVVLIALFIGAKAAGILGVFFAVPLAIILSVTLQEIHAYLLQAQLGATDAPAEVTPQPDNVMINNV
ncbi:MAG: AI-2E family transporter [Caldilineaceae bacterium]